MRKLLKASVLGGIGAIILMPIPGESHDQDFGWVRMGFTADWTGQDQAFTSGEIPKHRVQGYVLCDSAHVGFVATCWRDRPNGYPQNVPTDVIDVNVNMTPAWCTYKNVTIKVTTAPNGAAPKGDVYECRLRGN